MLVGESNCQVALPFFIHGHLQRRLGLFAQIIRKPPCISAPRPIWVRSVKLLQACQMGLFRQIRSAAPARRGPWVRFVSSLQPLRMGLFGQIVIVAMSPAIIPINALFSLLLPPFWFVPSPPSRPSKWLCSADPPPLSIFRSRILDNYARIFYDCQWMRPAASQIKFTRCF